MTTRRSVTTRAQAAAQARSELPGFDVLVEVQLLVLEHLLRGVHEQDLGLLLEGAKTFPWLALQLRTVCREWGAFVAQHPLFQRRARLEQLAYVSHRLALAYLTRNQKGARAAWPGPTITVTLHLPGSAGSAPQRQRQATAGGRSSSAPAPAGSSAAGTTCTAVLHVQKQKTKEERQLLPGMAAVVRLQLPEHHVAAASEPNIAPPGPCQVAEAAAAAAAAVGIAQQLLQDLAELDSRRICGVVLKLACACSGEARALEERLAAQLPPDMVVERSSDGRALYYIPTSFQFTRRARPGA
jgi:hypothetical protein